MIKKISSEDEIDAILNTLRPYREKCLYLYCNIERYRANNQNFELYSDTLTNSVIGVYYKDSVHLYTPNVVTEEINAFILREEPRTIFSSNRISICGYEDKPTGVYKLTKYVNSIGDSPKLNELSTEDMTILTDFLYTYSEDYQKAYNKQTLQAQMTERLQSGYCRYFGLFSDRRLIGCAFTKAEICDAMIVGGILVTPEKRGMGLGKTLCNYKAYIATQEKKDAYCFINDENISSIKLHSGCGYKKVATVFKYTKIL